VYMGPNLHHMVSYHTICGFVQGSTPGTSIFKACYCNDLLLHSFM